MTTCTSAVEISHLRKTYGNLVTAYAIVFGYLAKRFFRWE
jgi:hypothetical protein